MSPVTTLRRAGPRDAPLLARLLVHAWRARYRALVPDDVLDGLDEDKYASRFACVLARSAPHAMEVAVAAGGGRFRSDRAKRVEPEYGAREQRMRLDLEGSEEWRRLVP